MINDNLVIDAVCHAFDVSPENRAHGVSAADARNLALKIHKNFHVPLESTSPGYMLEPDEFCTKWTAEALASVYFEESDVDMLAYHSVLVPSLYQRRGMSPWEVGVDLKKLAPERVILIGCVDPVAQTQEETFQQMEDLVADGAVAFKFFPTTGYFDREANRLASMPLEDPEWAYPIYEKTLELGIDHLAFHRSQPFIGEITHPEEMATPARAFPNVKFEMVHAGWALLEETALVLRSRPNIWANLEGSINFVVRQPRRFAMMIGTLLEAAGPDRLMFGSGCMLNHPQPIIDAFLDFEMPEDLIQGYGFMPLTPEIKFKILGGNMAALHGIDARKVLPKLAADNWTRRNDDQPWKVQRELVAGASV